MKSFLKCELKFVVSLVIGFIILNGFVYILTKLVAFPHYFKWVFEGSIVAFGLYFIYFLYQFFKVLLFGNKRDCQNIVGRIASWLSSLV